MDGNGSLNLYDGGGGCGFPCGTALASSVNSPCLAEEEDSSIVLLHGRLSDLLFRTLRPATPLRRRALCLPGQLLCVRAMVAAGLSRGSGPESAVCDAGPLEFHPVFMLDGAPLLQRFWG